MSTKSANNAFAMANINKIILVGHCGFDGGNIARVAQQAAPQAEVSSADSAQDLEGVGPESLLLVNRVLDGGYGTSSGVELIQKLSTRDNPPATMLVSNFPDAQADAEKAGALPGYGKNDLATDAATSKIKAALNGG